MCSGSEEGSYLMLTDFVYHSTVGLRVIKKKEKRFRSKLAPGVVRRWSQRAFLSSPRNVQRFRSGLVFKADRRLYHSTLGLRVIIKGRRAPGGVRRWSQRAFLSSPCSAATCHAKHPLR